MNLNQKAIEMLEENQYDESLKLFKKAVETSRDIQSLNNLAWIYCYEEYDDTKALPLLEEAINMNLNSHFPYNLLGRFIVDKKNGNPQKIYWKKQSLSSLQKLLITT